MDIKQHIKTLGTTRKAICEEAGISRQFLWQVENGTREVGVDTIKDLARALKLRPHDLRPDWGAVFSEDNTND